MSCRGEATKTLTRSTRSMPVSGPVMPWAVFALGNTRIAGGMGGVESLQCGWHLRAPGHTRLAYMPSSSGTFHIAAGTNWWTIDMGNTRTKTNVAGATDIT